MPTNPQTVGQLGDLFHAWMDREVTSDRYAEKTAAYYKSEFGKFQTAVGADRPLEDLRAFDLESNKRGWHSVQAVQRVFNWGVDLGIVETNPFRRVKRPPLGQRERILSARELVKLLRASRQPLRRLLVAQRLTLARPQEMRAIRWHEYRPELDAFVLSEFKGKKRRKDGVKLRVLPVVPRVERLLQRLRRQKPRDTDHVFLNTHGKPWTSNALRLALGRAAERAGLNMPGVEHIVCYTLRHTGATEATAHGVQDRLLADMMGHADTRTTARYQHLETSHLVAAANLVQERRRAARGA